MATIFLVGAKGFAPGVQGLSIHAVCLTLEKAVAMAGERTDVDDIYEVDIDCMLSGLVGDLPTSTKAVRLYDEKGNLIADFTK